ncbi:MAG: flavin reductase family protein, partial [Bacteroidota bacterium]
FEIPKPIRTKGIGVDQLPKSIRESEVLTGNNLGRLGNVEHLPTAKEIETIGKHNEQQSLVAYHQLAKQWLSQGETMRALSLLMYADTHSS